MHPTSSLFPVRLQEHGDKSNWPHRKPAGGQIAFNFIRSYLAWDRERCTRVFTAGFRGWLGAYTLLGPNSDGQASGQRPETEAADPRSGRSDEFVALQVDTPLSPCWEQFLDLLKVPRVLRFACWKRVKRTKENRKKIGNWESKKSIAPLHGKDPLALHQAGLWILKR